MGSAPKAPDPYKTAEAQSNVNYQTAQQNVGFSNADVYSPYGTSTYTQTGWQPVYDKSGHVSGYSPRYRQDIKLSPQEEALRSKNTALRGSLADTALQQSNRIQGLLSKEFSPQDLQPWQRAAAPDAVRRDETATDRGAVQSAMMRLYDTEANKANAAQDAQMAARGLTAGGQGYGQMLTAQNDARTNAIDKAFLASGDEARAAQAAYNQAVQQKYQMGADWAAQLNNLRQNQFVEAQQLRDQPIKEISALMGLSGPNTPTFQSFQGSQMSAPSLEQGVWNKYNADVSNYQNNLSGMFGIASSIAGAIPWSDRRLKSDIRRLADRTLAGVPLYFFRYRKHPVLPDHLWGTARIGVMSDDVRALHPEAVLRGRDGYDRVDYDILYRKEAA